MYNIIIYYPYWKFSFIGNRLLYLIIILNRLFSKDTVPLEFLPILVVFEIFNRQYLCSWLPKWTRKVKIKLPSGNVQVRSRKSGNFMECFHMTTRQIQVMLVHLRRSYNNRKIPVSTYTWIKCSRSFKTDLRRFDKTRTAWKMPRWQHAE